MPRVKSRSGPYDELLKVLRGYELNGAALAAVIGAAPATGCRRLKDPGSLTISELRKISRGAGIPIAELRETITI